MRAARRVLVVGVVALASGVIACSGNRAEVTTFEPVRGEPMAPYVANAWTELPASPLGDWPLYNWVWLADGSGFVQAGGASVDGAGNITNTRGAAFFSFAERRYTTLPDLPVTSGLGVAGGAWVGDTLVIVGQDCPPMPDESSGALEFCRSGGMGAKVLLTLERSGTSWTSHTLPEWLDEFDYGTPSVIGIRSRRVILASGHEPAHLGEFDPVAGDWTRLPDAPGAPRPAAIEPRATETTVAPSTLAATTTSIAVEGSGPPPVDPYVPPAQVCLNGDRLVAWILGQPTFEPDRFGPPAVNQWYLLDGDAWTTLAAPLGGAVAGAACAGSGVFVTRYLADMTTDLSFVDLIAGTSRVVSTTSVGVLSNGPQYGLAVPVGDADNRLAVAIPDGVIPVTDDSWFGAYVGRYFVRPGDTVSDGAEQETRRPSMILEGPDV